MRWIIMSCGLALGASAQAGVYIEMASPKNAEESQAMWFDGGKVRIDVGNRAYSTVFANQTLYSIDHGDKSYTVMDKAAMDAMAGELRKARAEMEKQMASMPPEARARMQQMMGGKAEPADSHKVVATSRTDSAAGRSCKVWEVLESGEKTDELCVVPLETVPGGKEMMRTMQDFSRTVATMFEGLGNTGAQSGVGGFADLATLNGWPVIVRSFDKGRLESELLLRVVREESVAATTFSVPAGYRQVMNGR